MEGSNALIRYYQLRCLHMNAAVQETKEKEEDLEEEEEEEEVEECEKEEEEEECEREEEDAEEEEDQALAAERKAHAETLAALEAAKEEATAAKQQRDECQAELAATKEQLSSLQRAFDKSQKVQKDWAKALDEVAKQFLEREKAEQCESELAATKAELLSTQTAYEQCQDDLADVLADLARTQAELEQVKNEYQRKETNASSSQDADDVPTTVAPSPSWSSPANSEAPVGEEDQVGEATSPALRLPLAAALPDWWSEEVASPMGSGLHPDLMVLAGPGQPPPTFYPAFPMPMQYGVAPGQPGPVAGYFARPVAFPVQVPMPTGFF